MQHASPDLSCLTAEPEEEEQAAAKEVSEEKQGAEQQESDGNQQDSMQIEEVSQEGAGSSAQPSESGSVMQSMVGAAKSFFGGTKQDEQVRPHTRTSSLALLKRGSLQCRGSLLLCL